MVGDKGLHLDGMMHLKRALGVLNTQGHKGEIKVYSMKAHTAQSR